MLKTLKKSRIPLKASNELVEYAKKMEAAVWTKKEKKEKYQGSKAVSV